MDAPFQSQPRIRQGKAPNLFKRFWEEGHDPLKPYIEETDAEGNVTRKKPEAKSFNVCDMEDDELGDFLGEEERQALAVARKQQKETKGRDICREVQEAKEREEKEAKERLEALTQRNQILEEHARQQEKALNDYKAQTEKKIDKLASLIAQLLEK
jgi:DNA anti-recombination protein RmuC